MVNRDATRGLDENCGIRRNRIPAECHLGGKGEHGRKTTRVLATSERASARASFVLRAIKPWDDHEGLLLRAKMRRPGSATGMPSSRVFFFFFWALFAFLGGGFWLLECCGAKWMAAHGLLLWSSYGLFFVQICFFFLRTLQGNRSA